MKERRADLPLSKKFVERYSSVALVRKMSDSENRSTCHGPFWDSPGWGMREKGFFSYVFIRTHKFLCRCIQFT